MAIFKVVSPMCRVKKLNRTISDIIWNWKYQKILKVILNFYILIFKSEQKHGYDKEGCK
jgi:hypothetical protein